MHGDAVRALEQRGEHLRAAGRAGPTRPPSARRAPGPRPGRSRRGAGRSPCRGRARPRRRRWARPRRAAGGRGTGAGSIGFGITRMARAPRDPVGVERGAVRLRDGRPADRRQPADEAGEPPLAGATPPSRGPRPRSGDGRSSPRRGGEHQLRQAVGVDGHQVPAVGERPAGERERRSDPGGRPTAGGGRSTVASASPSSARCRAALVAGGRATTRRQRAVQAGQDGEEALHASRPGHRAARRTGRSRPAPPVTAAPRSAAPASGRPPR